MVSSTIASLAVVCLLIGAASAGLLDIPSDLKWTMAINDKVCQDGGHPDAVSEKFFACYDESLVPGATKFIHCQEEVYGVLMNSEANMDKVCNASKDKFPRYAACLAWNRVKLTEAMPKLNECQGAVVGVSKP